MKCAWPAFLSILPVWMRRDVDRQGRDTLQELRLHLNAPPELVTINGIIRLQRNITQEDLQHCVNIASSYSPWAAATAAYGYITAAGGHRIGLCGEAVMAADRMKGIRKLTSLCLRVARDFSGISGDTGKMNGSILIIGKPGSGKTTFLRDLIRQKSNCGLAVSVVDQREEIFPRTADGFCFPIGQRTDVLSGCSKPEGIEAVLRCMSPDIIAVDEITAGEDCAALHHAGWCGVGLLATAHAGSREDLFSRPVYKPLIESKLFNTLIILAADKSFRRERMYI